jgi:hypothetical protein
MTSTDHFGDGRTTSTWDLLLWRSAASITTSVSAYVHSLPDGTRWQGAAIAGLRTMQSIETRGVLCLERLPRAAPLWAMQ